MMKHSDQPATELLQDLCEGLLSVQSEEGGFRCDACGFLHGRADNAVFPFLLMYSRTKDIKWLGAVRKLLEFRRSLTNGDGSVSNDFEAPWKGITVFSAIGLYKSLHNFENILPDDIRRGIEKCFTDSAHWVNENVKPPFRANINYYCASAAVNAMYAERYGDVKYADQAKELLSCCMGLFTENGILRGEGQPHDFITKGGCVPADIGYIVEEAIPCLTDAAMAMGDEKALEKLADYSERLLEFSLPDGAWDNSFGSRSNKWTYYGSRTASGCAGAFTVLGKYRPALIGEAKRNIALMRDCTKDGILCGGREYALFGQKSCIHHSFTHICSLADAVLFGIDETRERGYYVPEKETHHRYFPELKVLKIRYGKWIATVSGYDYSTYTFGNGAAHSSGGSLSLLYHTGCGPVIAGSVYDYKRTELNNMQEPPGEIPHRSLIPRVETEKNGKSFSTSLCFDSEIKINENGESLTVTVITAPETVEHERPEGAPECIITYRFTEDSVGISVDDGALPYGARLVVPVISSSGVNVTGKYADKEKIFFLTGGFGADEYTFAKGNMKLTISK